MRLLKNDNSEKKQLEMLIDGKNNANRSEALNEVRDLLENKYEIEKDKVDNIIARLDIKFTELEKLSAKKESDPIETMASFVKFIDLMEDIKGILDEADSYCKR